VSDPINIDPPPPKPPDDAAASVVIVCIGGRRYELRTEVVAREITRGPADILPFPPPKPPP